MPAAVCLPTIEREDAGHFNGPPSRNRACCYALPAAFCW
jgi:hypothetical protein